MPEDGDGLSLSRVRGPGPGAFASLQICMNGETSHARGVDLNTASADELSRLVGMGRTRANSIVHARPLREWDDVARLDGFGPDLVRELQHAGARIGGSGGGGDRPGREHA